MAGSVLSAEGRRASQQLLSESGGLAGGTGLGLFQDLHRDAEAPWILCFLFIFLHGVHRVLCVCLSQERRGKERLPCRGPH